MTRRALMMLPGAGACSAWRREGGEAYPGVAYRDYSRCLPDYLRRLAARAYEKRNRELAKLTTPAAVRERQRWVRETFWKLAGGEPVRTPLNARTVGGFERPGYRVEKVVYESRPGLHVTANLYVPTSVKPPLPGVLFQMGHALNGKAAEAYQFCCQGLVKLGYLVLAFDPMGQGERVYYPAPGKVTTRLGSADDEHTVPGKQMLLVGDTATRFQVWDAVRSLDYLAAHPLVDPKRLASTGNSGGGTLTMLLAAVDDRLAAAAPSCPNTENLACADFNPPGSTDDAEQNLIGAGPLGFDRWDLLYPLAPKPLLVIVSDKDYFGTYSPRYISSGWEEFGKLKRVYETLGRSECLGWASSPLPHGLGYYPRLRIYNWFARWLKGESGEIVEEPPVAAEREETLLATASGSVVRSLGSETPFTLLRRRAASLKPKAVEAGEVARLLEVDRPPASVQAVVLGRVPMGAVEVEAIEVNSAPGVWLPAWLFLPRRPARAALLALEPGGRNARWSETGMYAALASEGFAVCAADVRGIGDLNPEFPRGAARHAQPRQGEENYAWASMMLGKPLVGQRTTDILALLAALGSHPAWKGRPVTLAALGKMTVPALFAAVLNKDVATLYLAGGLPSFRGLVETENYDHPFANFTPGLLLHTDLPELAAALGPRRARLAGPAESAWSAGALRSVLEGPRS